MRLSQLAELEISNVHGFMHPVLYTPKLFIWASRSEETGYDHRMEFMDSLLSGRALELSSNATFARALDEPKAAFAERVGTFPFGLWIVLHFITLFL